MDGWMDGWMDGIFSQIQNLSPPFNPIYALGFVIACPDFYREGLK